MLQYLFNATAIWLISLLVFELTLRRQSYHGYNRAYLLLTFAAGIVLPLLHWQRDTTIHLAHLERPVAQLAVARQMISNNTTAVALSHIPWVYVAYLIGVFVMLAMLLIDIAKLLKLYNSGRQQKENDWLIIETYKEHAPFSFLKILFVSSRRLYDKNEWQMLIVHEGRHSSLLHFADVALMQMARIVFWFHPAVYLYNKRLTMLHEYQADSAARTHARVYGRFLAEQCMLQAAPSVAHALSNSPLKDRILMLTHRSPRYSQLSKLLLVPLIALFMICFTRYDISYQIAEERTTRVYSTAPQTQFTIDETLPLQQLKEQAGTPATQLPSQKYKASPCANTQQSHYLPPNSDVILLGGMENNANATCCSSGLLWGNDYGRMSVSEGYPKYTPAYLNAGNVNSCTPGIDQYRKEQYAAAVERYSYVLDKWNAQTQSNVVVNDELMTDRTTQLIIADDPWSLTTEKKAIATPTLSIDRTIFGQSTRTIFDGATALAKNTKERGTTIHFKNLSFNP